MTKIIIIAGLPGSGKTEYGKSLEQKGIWFVSDFKKDAIDDNPHFPNSRYYIELFNRLHKGITCAIADIDFCREEAQMEAEDCIRALVPNIKIEWQCFENNPEKCLENVRRRNSPTVASEEEKIRRYSQNYRIRPDQTKLPVYDQK